MVKNRIFSLGFGEKLMLTRRGRFRVLKNRHDTKAWCFFSNFSIMRLLSKFYSILLHLGLWVFLLEATLVYECAFWRQQCKICNIFRMSNFQSPSQRGVHLEHEIPYFILCICFLHSRLLRVNSQEVLWQFKLFI